MGSPTIGRTAYGAFLEMRRFGSLDGLRALSIFAVIWHHAASEAFKGSQFEYIGSEGVTLFFAISGFLITSLLVRERGRRGAIDLPAFYIRRSLRIFPLYFAVLGLYVLLVVVMESGSLAGQQFFHHLPYFLTYTSNWFVPLDGRVIFFFAWSLAAEEQFYLLWPLVLVLCVTSERAMAWMGGLVAVLIGVELTGMLWLGFPPKITWVALRIPMAILLGSLGGLALHEPRGFKALSPLFVGRMASIVWMGLSVAALLVPGVPRFMLHAPLVGLVIACAVNLTCPQPAIPA